MSTAHTTKAKRLAHLESLAKKMDSQWTMPYFGARMGWDTIIGLIPGIGDTLTTFISVYILRQAHLMGVPLWVKWRMTWNIFIDWLIGLIPLIGDIFDIGWKANLKNIELIKKHAKH